MYTSLNITADEAAYLLQANKRWVYSACERHLIGDAFSKNGKRRTVKISDGKMAEWLGWPMEKLEQAVKEIRSNKGKGI